MPGYFAVQVFKSPQNNQLVGQSVKYFEFGSDAVMSLNRPRQLCETSGVPIETKLLSFQGQIHLIETDDGLARASEHLLTSQILGFDTETKPSFVRGQVHKVALLQLSTETDAFVIRLHPLRQFQILTQLFENSEIVKTGVAIRDDIKTLQKLFKFEPKGFVELQDLAKEKGLTKFGLKGMAEEVLEGTLNKGPKMTNWELPNLTKRQLLYAATDAWIGLELYKKIKG